jgi:hypothetical protein
MVKPSPTCMVSADLGLTSQILIQSGLGRQGLNKIEEKFKLSVYINFWDIPGLTRRVNQYIFLEIQGAFFDFWIINNSKI